MPKTHGEGATHLTKPNPGRRTMDIPELARVLGIGTRQDYQAARRDELPVPTIRLGKQEWKIVGVFDGQMDVFSTSARVLDDGVIDPRDTRAVLLNVLSICREAEARNPQKVQFSVARP